MRFCEAMADLGLAVEVVSLNVRLDYEEPSRSRDLFSVYGVSTPFEVTILPSFDRQTRETPRISALWRVLAYTWYVFWTLIARGGVFRYLRTVVYFKNYLLAIPFLCVRQLLGERLVLLFEGHVPPSHALGGFVLRRVDGVVAVSRILASELKEKCRVDPRRILVAHQGVNLSVIEDGRLGRDEARAKLDLPADSKLAVYTGKVHSSSGEIRLLLQAAKHLPQGVVMVIVGGREDQVSHLQTRAEREGICNVSFLGFVAPAEVFHYQMAADVLVTYYPSDLPLNKYRASPGKLFEYMASRRPIVTADYPALREALSPGAALFVEKDDPERLAQGIKQVLEDERLARDLADQAYRDVQGFTWERRAESILEFIDALPINDR
jgi:glycosyltransferase involved in cell wall biosynthesis